jgi:hypothetical protein
MFTVKLSYKEDYLDAMPALYLYFFGLDRLVFFHEAVFLGPAGQFYGTLTKALPVQWEYPQLKWDILMERNLIRDLTNLGVVRGIAAAHPVSEVNN